MGDYMIEIDTEDLNKFRLKGSKDKKKRKKAETKGKSVKEIVQSAYKGTKKEPEKKKLLPWQSDGTPEVKPQTIYSIK